MNDKPDSATTPSASSPSPAPVPAANPVPDSAAAPTSASALPPLAWRAIAIALLGVVAINSFFLINTIMETGMTWRIAGKIVTKLLILGFAIAILVASWQDSRK